MDVKRMTHEEAVRTCWNFTSGVTFAPVGRPLLGAIVPPVGMTRSQRGACLLSLLHGFDRHGGVPLQLPNHHLSIRLGPQDQPKPESCSDGPHRPGWRPGTV